MPTVVAALEREALVDKAFYVSKATTGQQRVVHDLRSLRNDRCDYFSMVVVAKQDRNGVLTGRVAAAPAPGTE